MDSLHRQGPNPNQSRSPNPQQQQMHHQQAQARNPQNIASSSYAYPTPSSMPNDNDFNSFFNDDPSSGFNAATWDAPALIDPRMQANGYSQPSNSWDQNQLPGSNSLHQPMQTMQSNSYDNTFPQAQPLYNGYQNFGPYQYASTSYQHAPLPYGQDSILSNTAYPNHSARSYSEQSFQNQTISPAALQNYPPHHFSQFQSQPENEIKVETQVKTENQSVEKQTKPVPDNASRPPALSERPIGTLRPTNLYDEEKARSLAAQIPAGSSQGSLSVIDPSQLAQATNSEKFSGFVFIGNQAMEIDDSRVVLPKIASRKSTKELKRKALEDQAGRPWDLTQRSIMKRLKLKTPRPSTNKGTSQQPVESSSSSPEDSSSSEESSDGSDSEELEIEDRSPLPETRPSDSLKAAEYDVIRALWHKHSTSVNAQDIRKALGEYWGVVKGIRDTWNADVSALADAEEKKNQAKIDHHKPRALKQRQIMEHAITATMEHGHKDITERLGEIPQLLIVLYQFIIDRYKDNDQNGSLVTNILKLLLNCKSLDQAKLEKAKLDKVLSRLIKRGDDKVKALAQKIRNEADKGVKSKTAVSKDNQVSDSSKVSKSSAVTHKNGESVAGVKRPREAESASQVTKRSSSISVKSTAVSTSSKPVVATGSKTTSVAPRASSVKSDGKPSAGTAAAATKIKHVSAKPSSYLTGLLSASKKPGTSTSAQKAVLSSDTKLGSSADTKNATQPAPKAFSFAEIMANLDKPKPVEAAKSAADDRPPETEDEKRKRLRKEERRKLRVRFKPEASLVEVRLFHHDPEEELGHDDNMIRDVADIKNEGRMMKLHKELELDDDEDGSGDQDLIEFHTPTLVDWSGLIIDPVDLMNNYESRGGRKAAKSPEGDVQKQRELTCFIVYYNTLGDIPYTPKEPADPYSGLSSQERSFGEPNDDTKRRSAHFFAIHNIPHPGQSVSAMPSSAPSTDISSLLSILNGSQQPHQRQHSQQVPASADRQPGLEAIFAQFAAPAQHTHKPQAQPTNPQIDHSIQKALNIFNQQQQNQLPQAAYGQPPPAAQPTADLSVLLAQLNPQANGQSQGYNYPNQYGLDNDRKRQYEGDNQTSHDQYNDTKRTKVGVKKYYGVPKVPCKFFKEGKCKKGDDCTFLHT